MKNIKLKKEELDVILSVIDAYFFLFPESEIKEALDNIIKKLKRALKPIKISSAKSKGRNLQKKVCQDIAELLDIEYDQQDDQCLIHSREMGQSGVDVILRGGAFEKFPFSVECKSTERLNLLKTIEQAKNNKSEYTDWLIVHKNKTLNHPIAILGWEEFLQMIKRKNDVIRQLQTTT